MIIFDAGIEAAPHGGAYVTIPTEAVQSLGGGGRIPVVASFDGIEYRGSIVRMGGVPILGVLKEIREVLGKTFGDRVVVSVERDQSERKVEVPVELAQLLDSNPVARDTFEALSYSHRREHAAYVSEAKKAETRVRRAHKTVDTLLA